MKVSEVELEPNVFSQIMFIDDFWDVVKSILGFDQTSDSENEEDN